MRIGFVAASTCLAAVAFACSSSETKTVTVYAEAGATPIVDSGPVRIVQIGPARGTPIACVPQSLDGGFATSFPPPRGLYPGVCTDEQIASYASACALGGVLSEECKALRAASPACDACVFSQSGAYTFKPETNIVYSNTQTCFAIRENDAGPSGCAAASNAYFNCSYAACGDVCSPSDTGSVAELTQCVTTAATTVCKDIATVVAQSCPLPDAGGSLTDPFAGPIHSCATAAPQTLDQAIAFATKICGFAPLTDAGTDAGDSGKDAE